MSKEEKKDFKNQDVYITAPEGKLKILDGFKVQVENRKLAFTLLEDGSTVINVIRYQESEEAPYTEEVTNQVMRLSKLTIALLMACLTKANDDFGIDADVLISELNAKRAKEQISECVVCGEEYLDSYKDSDTCLDCRNN
jgi:hypothetical protein